MIRGKGSPFALVVTVPEVTIGKSDMFNGFFVKPDMNFRNDIQKSQKNIKRMLKTDMSEEKKARLRLIRKELKLLKLQLDNL